VNKEIGSARRGRNGNERRGSPPRDARTMYKSIVPPKNVGVTAPLVHVLPSWRKKINTKPAVGAGWKKSDPPIDLVGVRIILLL